MAYECRLTLICAGDENDPPVWTQAVGDSPVRALQSAIVVTRALGLEGYFDVRLRANVRHALPLAHGPLDRLGVPATVRVTRF